MTPRLEPLLCELHSHTTWSDGLFSLRELADFYGRQGYDVLCVTDHVVRAADPWYEHPRSISPASHSAYLAEIDAEAERARLRHGLLLVPGLELSYNDEDPLLAAHAVAVGLRDFVSVDASIDEAMAVARESGAAIVAAHPYSVRQGRRRPRKTQRFARDWRSLRGLVDRFELFNQDNLYGWVAQAGLPAVATGDFHRPDHFPDWKTLVPCAKDEEAIVDYLRSPRPVYLARLDAARTGTRLAA